MKQYILYSIPFMHQLKKNNFIDTCPFKTVQLCGTDQVRVQNGARRL